jgi:hypothetical protein
MKPFQLKIKQWWSTILPMSSKTKQSLNSDGQQFYQYQQNKTINNAITILVVIWD